MLSLFADGCTRLGRSDGSLGRNVLAMDHQSRPLCTSLFSCLVARAPCPTHTHACPVLQAQGVAESPVAGRCLLWRMPLSSPQATARTATARFGTAAREESPGSHAERQALKLDKSVWLHTAHTAHTAHYSVAALLFFPNGRTRGGWLAKRGRGPAASGAAPRALEKHIYGKLAERSSGEIKRNWTPEGVQSS